MAKSASDQKGTQKSRTILCRLRSVILSKRGLRRVCVRANLLFSKTATGVKPCRWDREFWRFAVLSG